MTYRVSHKGGSMSEVVYLVLILGAVFLAVLWLRGRNRRR